MDFIDYLGKLLGISMEVVPSQTWPQIVAGMKERKLDVAATMVLRPEREAFVNFTEIYLPTPLVIMQRQGGPAIHSEKDLERITVGLVEGYSASVQVMEDYPNAKPLIWRLIEYNMRRYAKENKRDLFG